MQNQQNQKLEQEVEISEELVKQLLELLANNNVEVKHGTLSAILQYTASDESKSKFKDTNLFSLILKNVFNPKLTTICLSTLIHFTSCDIYQSQFVRFIEPLILQLKEWKNLEQQLTLLFLLNVSKSELVIEKIINKEEKKGYFIELLYAVFELREKHRWVIINIFVNITSIDFSRRYFCEQKIYSRFIKYILERKQNLREATLKIFRNCAFEWEEQLFITDILSSQYKLIDTLGKLISYIVYKKELITNNNLSEQLLNGYFPDKQEVQELNQHFEISQKLKALAEVELAIDIILILSNCEFKEKKPDLNIQNLKNLITLLKFTQIKDSTKDKLQALEIFCFW